MTATPEDESKVAYEIMRYARTINWYASGLQILTVAVALSSIGLSLVVSAYAGVTNGLPVLGAIQGEFKLVALFSALSTAVYSSFQLQSKAVCMRNAYRLIAVDLLRYRVGELTISQLITTYAHAERIVGHVEVQGIGRSDSYLKPEPRDPAPPAS